MHLVPETWRSLYDHLVAAPLLLVEQLLMNMKVGERLTDDVSVGMSDYVLYVMIFFATIFYPSQSVMVFPVVT